MLLDQLFTYTTRRKPISVLRTIAALKARQLCQQLSHRHNNDELLPTDEQCRSMLMREAKRLHGRNDHDDTSNDFSSYKNNSSSPILAPALLEVKTSNIPNSGSGVFLTKCKTNNTNDENSNNDYIPAGTVLATYGGMYIPPIPIVGSPYYGPPPKTLIPMDGNYMYCCENGGWINGNSDASFLPSFSGQSRKTQQQNNHHDVAQFANHSPKPNAVTVTLFDYPQNMGVYSPPVGTPWYYCTDSNEMISIPAKIRLKGVVLVSIEDLYAEGDEVYFDYGINPPERRPDWYEPPMNDYGEEESGYYITGIFERAMEEIEERRYCGKN